jgi:hypothetical protein
MTTQMVVGESTRCKPFAPSPVSLPCRRAARADGRAQTRFERDAKAALERALAFLREAIAADCAGDRVQAFDARERADLMTEQLTAMLRRRHPGRGGA